MLHLTTIMADKEISTINDGYPDQERRATIASINLNKNLDAKYETELPLSLSLP